MWFVMNLITIRFASPYESITYIITSNCIFFYFRFEKVNKLTMKCNILFFVFSNTGSDAKFQLNELKRYAKYVSMDLITRNIYGICQFI